ncbi:hypothetical protein MTR67_042214 [Solanum verrucosum]|uniref:gluconokinase n=1 Tax=Solanum verrucosum TaxID=315347 RepID=A0AAF0ZTX0_SOLVR|nr:hypothetical protein MTR67_042214 [Solanum verrucosum]
MLLLLVALNWTKWKIKVWDLRDAQNLVISEGDNHLMLSTSSTCNCVISFPKMASDYREILRSADPNYEPGSYARIVKFVLLEVGDEVLAARLVKRAAEGKHFMPAKPLQTQLDLLQIDEAEGILKVDATMDPDTILKTIQTYVI